MTKTTAIILRKDFQRVRKRCKTWVRKGKMRAQKDEDRRIQKVISALDDEGIHPEYWDEKKQEHLAEMMEAVLKEFGGKDGMSIDAIARMVRLVIVTAVMKELVKQGQLEERTDSYGRKMFRSKRKNFDE